MRGSQPCRGEACELPVERTGSGSRRESRANQLLAGAGTRLRADQAGEGEGEEVVVAAEGEPGRSRAPPPTPSSSCPRAATRHAAAAAATTTILPARLAPSSPAAAAASCPPPPLLLASTPPSDPIMTPPVRSSHRGPDPCREKRRSSFDTTTPHESIEPDQDLVGAEEEGGEEDALDPAKHSFSIALKECQNRRFRSEALAASPAAEGKHRRRRPASLDLNGAQANDAPFSSPGFFIAGPGMKKSSAVSVRSRSGTFPSPSTPNYRHNGGAAGYQKGWSSERVPLPANSSRRYGSTSALLPFNNGRTLPSKWEDAEKWIFSPVSGEVGVGRSTGVPPHHRRPKSKSGPLGTPMGMGMGNSYSSASPPVPVFDRGRIRNFAESSPFLTGVLITDRGCCGSASSGRGGSGSAGVGMVGREGGGRRSYSGHGDEGIVRSVSVHGCSDLLLQSSSSLPSSRDEKLEGGKDADIMNSPVILRKDVATQMSPEDSNQSSPKERPHFSPSAASSPRIEELQRHFTRLEVRDVQVDDRVTMTRWSKKHIARGTDRSLANIVEWKKKTVESRASTWEVAETAKCISKFKREEAKITAWENLQKAKAEAAIRKLEMKLEKKRSSSMDKILNKLKSAQRKAQEMRNAVTATQATQVARTPKMSSASRKAGHMGSLSGCFTCHAF